MMLTWWYVCMGLYALRFLWKQIWITRCIEYYDENKIPFATLNKMSALCSISYLDPEDIIRLKKKENHALSARAQEIIRHIKHEVTEFDDQLLFIDTSEVNDGIFAESFVWLKHDERTIYIIIRGTDTIEDWQVNLDLQSKSMFMGENVCVHQGFMRQFDSIEPYISHILKEHRPAFDKIVITGHSLGGSVSTIASVFYNEFYQGSVPIYLYTFGCPRVGNKNLRDFMKARLRTFDDCWRVYDFEDPVPMIPIRPEFEHVDFNALCLHRGNVLNTNKTDINLPLRFFNLISCTPLLKPAAKHNIHYYTQSLRQHMRLVPGRFFP